MVKKSTRPRGRPRRFEEAEALAGATRVFWAKGYDGATVDDLVVGMGVGRPSLYAIFGDKASLFMRCLEDYGGRSGALVARALLDPPGVREAIREFLRFSVVSATREGSPPGCLLACVAPLVDDERVRAFLVLGVERMTEMVERRLRAGIDAGELPPDFPAALRARHTLELSGGLVMRARIGLPREDLLADADEAAVLLLASPVE